MPYYRIVVLLFTEFFLIFISQIQSLSEKDTPSVSKVQSMHWIPMIVARRA